MDREIPKEVRQKERNKKIIRYSAIGVAGVIVVSVLISLMRVGVEEKDLVFSTVDKGVIEVSVSASGKVVPAFEEIINSPINSRILEIYKKGGDSVEIGTPILKLDLQSTETQYQKLLELDGVELVFDKDALVEIAKTSLARKTGARGLRAIMEKIMMDTMYHVPSDDSIKYCRITKEVVQGIGKPIYETENREVVSA